MNSFQTLGWIPCFCPPTTNLPLRPQNVPNNMLAAQIEIPSSKKESKTFSFEVTLNQLKEIHQKIF